MHPRKWNMLLGLGVVLAVVALVGLGLMLRADRRRARRLMLSRHAVALVDEAIAAAPAPDLEIRERSIVPQGRGRASWTLGEFVVATTAPVASGLRARVGDLARPVGLRVSDEGGAGGGSQAIHRWSVGTGHEAFVHVRVHVTPSRISTGPPASAPARASSTAPVPGPPSGAGAEIPAAPPGVPAAVANVPAVPATAPGAGVRRPAAPPRVSALRPCPPQAAIIIDDVGFVWSTAMAFLHLDRPLTLALFPNLENSARIARRAHAHGREIIMHLPMESGARDVNPQTLHRDMTADEMVARWNAATATLPGIVGVNNHQGSLMTADAVAMERVLTRVQVAKLFFIDSRTTTETVARSTAERLGVPTNENDLFLDNVKDVEYIKQKCRELLALALVQGEVIGIAHAHPVTLQALQEVLPEFDAAGVRLVYVSALVN